MEHISVLKDDVEKLMNLKEGNVVIDTTLGLGGHALGLLKKIGKTGNTTIQSFIPLKAGFTMMKAKRI